MKITVYTTSTCPFCKQIKSFLDDNNKKYEEIDVSVNHEKAQEMIHKTGQMGVPVVEVGNDVIVGFDKEKLKELLDL